MRGFVREHTVSITAILTILSLGLVFGAVFQVGGEVLPDAPAAMLGAIPHLNAAISLLAIVTILSGVRAIRRGDVEGHRRRMLAAFGLFATFLVLYLYRVSIEGPSTFEGPDILRTAIYYPTLVIHVTLAVVCLPLLFYVLSLAYAYPVSQIPETNHRRVGRVATVLWVISFTLGVVVYLLLYGLSWG